MTTCLPLAAQPDDPLTATPSPATATVTAWQILSRLARALGCQAAHEPFGAVLGAARASADQPEMR